MGESPTNLFAALLDSTDVGFCAVDQDRIVKYVNRAWAKMLHADPHDFIGGPYEAIGAAFHEAPNLDSMFESSFGVRSDFVIAKTLGGRYCLLNSTPLRMFEVGDLRVISLTDVTPVLSGSDRVMLSHKQFDALNTSVVITNPLLPDHPITYVNRHFEVMTGYRAVDVIGTNCRFLQRDDRNQPGRAKLQQAIAEKRSAYAVLRNYRKNGSAFLNELSISPVFNSDGEVVQFIGIQREHALDSPIASYWEELVAAE
jgi:PAS domain S-box-containing protein